jgi:DNA-binding MarR family transcriptional regulator
MGSNHSPSEKTVERLIDAFWETVPPIWHIVRAHHHHLATEHFGITVEQFHILRRIHFGHNTVSELADYKQISRSSTSRTVDLLVNKGLVKRLPDAEDRRRVTLELTTEGYALMDRLFEFSRAWIAQKINILAEEDVETAIKGLEIMRTAFDVTDFPHPKPH